MRKVLKSCNVCKYVDDDIDGLLKRRERSFSGSKAGWQMMKIHVGLFIL